MVSEVPVVWQVQNSKPVDTLILPAVATNNQPVPHPTGETNNHKFSLNDVSYVLEIYQVCAKVMPSIVPMAVRTFEFVGDSDFWNHKKIRKTLGWYAQKPFDL